MSRYSKLMLRHKTKLKSKNPLSDTEMENPESMEQLLRSILD